MARRKSEPLAGAALDRKLWQAALLLMVHDLISEPQFQAVLACVRRRAADREAKKTLTFPHPRKKML